MYPGIIDGKLPSLGVVETEIPVDMGGVTAMEVPAVSESAATLESYQPATRELNPHDRLKVEVSRHHLTAYTSNTRVLNMNYS